MPIPRGAAELAATEPKIDVLINNAGTWFNRREMTPEGFERTFALNHMAYVVLTFALKEPLLRANGARVINTGSFVYRSAKYDPANMQAERRFSTNNTYAATKLYNLLFTRALARHWASDGITVNCFSPGFVATNFGAGEGGLLESFYRFIRRFGKTPEKGAETLVYLATSPDVANVTGEYFENCRSVPVVGIANDDDVSEDLFRRSLHFAKLGAPEPAWGLNGTKPIDRPSSDGIGAA